MPLVSGQVFNPLDLAETAARRCSPQPRRIPYKQEVIGSNPAPPIKGMARLGELSRLPGMQLRPPLASVLAEND